MIFTTRIFTFLILLLISPPMVRDIAQAAFSDWEPPNSRLNSSNEVNAGRSHLYFSYDLTAVLKEGTTGVSLEALPKEASKKLEKQAKNFIAFRRGKLSNDKKAILLAECLSRPGSNPFCVYLHRDWVDDLKMKEEEYGSNGKKKKRIPIKEIVQMIESADLDKLSSARRYRILRALNRFNDWKRLEPITKKLLEGSACPKTKVFTALGLKAEEYFPGEKFRKLAIGFYKRADECGARFDAEANLARFRKSLIHVWNNECSKATPALKVLGQDLDGLYITRALYWQAHCAALAGDKLRVSILRNQMMKVNPLGYHTLLLNRDRAFQLVNMVYTKKAEVVVRTRTRPELNQHLMAAEILLEMKRGRRYSREILEYVESELPGTELAFRLYVGLMFKRVRDAIAPLRIIAGIFREDPSMITQDTLKIFYPLKRFRTLWSHRSKVDPYLLAALIRQESGFDERARSHAGALGLMQLMPATARRMARVSRRQLLKASTNVRLGARYLKRLIRKFEGDAELALAAYNAGPGKVDDWTRRYTMNNRMLFLDLIPFSETRNYVVLISRNYFWYLNLYAQKALTVERSPGRQIASRSNKVVFRTFQMN